MSQVFKLGRRITLVPVIHGSGDFALAIRRLMLDGDFDCVAVPLPPSFQEHVEQAIECLPEACIVVQREPPQFAETSADQTESSDQVYPRCSYVPIDPCQPV